MFLILFIAIGMNAYPCASFLADKEDVRSGGSTKHFSSSTRGAKRIIIKNELNAPCELEIKLLDILPKSDGTYRYLAYHEGRSLYHSLSPVISIVDNEGRSLVRNLITLKAKEVVSAKIVIDESHLEEGTYHGAFQTYFPKFPAQLSLAEVYYSKGEIATPQLSLSELSFNPLSQKVRYLIRGVGKYYTFIKFEISFIDPETGFELKGYENYRGEFKKFEAYIKNYWLPGKDDQRLIKSEFDLKNFNEIFKKKYSQKYPNTDWKTKKWVALVRLRYGIDFNKWSYHNYLSLPPKAVELYEE